MYLLEISRPGSAMPLLLQLEYTSMPTQNTGQKRIEVKVDGTIKRPASNVTFVFDAETMLKEDRKTITTATNHLIPSSILDPPRMTSTVYFLKTSRKLILLADILANDGMWHRGRNHFSKWWRRCWFHRKGDQGAT